MTSLGLIAKTPTGDFEIINSLLEKKENFAFSRFSDGEVLVLNRIEVSMAPSHNKIGHATFNAENPKDAGKHYIPEEHESFRSLLEDSLRYRANNYYKGISCKCCLIPMWGKTAYESQFRIIGTGDEHNLTWSNLFINSNYKRYVDETLPLLKDRQVFMVVNEAADLSQLPFDVVKSFRVGENCMINNMNTVFELVQFIHTNKIEDAVFLCAASSLSNIIIHQAYKNFPNNTYIDVGSSLNPFMPGIESRREYHKILTNPNFAIEECIW